VAEEAADRGCADQRASPNGWKHFDLAERAARFGYWRTTLADGKMFWSDGMYRLLGTDPSTQLPDSDWLLDQINPDDVRELQERIAAAVETRSSFTYRTRAKSPDAIAQIVETVGEIDVGPDGNVVAIVGVCTDITAQVTAEAEREIAKERYRVMAEGASDIIVLHENDQIVCASSALERLLGRKPEEMQQGRYLELVHPDDLDEAMKVRGRPPPGETRTAVYRIRHADGQYIWFETSTRGVYDETTGEFLKEIAVARDVTERKAQELEMRAAQLKAEAANRAKSLFLANMSHELRTPLNAIMGFADMMRQHVFGILGDARYDGYAAEIHNSAKLLMGRITDVLEIANIEAGMLELALEPVDLRDVVDACAHEVGEAFRKRAISLARHVDDACTVTADRHALRQILLQLLSNALKFTAPGGHVSVDAGNSGSCTVLTVRDDGIGIPASELPRLGRPFEQVCAERYLTKNGQGLGLALVRALVEKHGGSFAIEGELEKGTCIRIELPRGAHQTADAAPSKGAPRFRRAG
jgi:two-component system cell cycle sensor histidine kinase PleC